MQQEKGAALPSSTLGPAFDALAHHLVVDPIEDDESKVRPAQPRAEGRNARATLSHRRCMHHKTARLIE